MSVIDSPVDLAAHHLSFTFPAAPASAGAARREAAAGLESWGARLDMDVFALLLSELVTNAVKHAVAPEHADGPVIGVEVRQTATGVRVAVHDPDQGKSRGVALRTASEHSESGRGLELVDALAADWGCQYTETGKSVFFDLDALEPGNTDDHMAPKPSELSSVCDAADLPWLGEWW